MKKLMLFMFSVVIMLALTSGVVAACGGTTATTTTPSASATAASSTVVYKGAPPAVTAKKPYTIALIVKTLDNPYWVSVVDGAKAASKELGIKLVVDSPAQETDIAEQVNMVETAVTQKVDAILLAPADSKGLIPAVEEANAANIPVVNIDTQLDGGKTVTFLATDNVQAASIAGQYVVKELNGKGNVAILEGVPGQETAQDRLKGFTNVLSKYPGIKIVATQAANWDQATALSASEDILRAHPDVNCIYSGNDLMAAGAAEAIAEIHKTGQILNVTFDLGVGGKMISQGTLNASITQFPVTMGDWGVKYAVVAIQGGKVAPYVNTGVALVTKANLAKFYTP